MKPWATAIFFIATFTGCGETLDGGDNPPRNMDMDAGGTDAKADAGIDAGERCKDGPLSTPIAGCEPSPLSYTGDDAADCVARINQLRWKCQCLPPLQRWSAGESCADEHAEYDSTRSAHSGFRNNICPNGGSGQNECPGWPSITSTVTGCLQAMWNEGPGEPFSKHGHYLNMTNDAFSKVACGFYTTSGSDMWAIQNFSR